MRRIALVLALVALGGCLAARDEAEDGLCQAWLTAGDVPVGALQEGGDGPRTITVDVELGDHAPFIAYWPGPNATVQFVPLRTQHLADTLTVRAPADTDIGLLAGLTTPATGTNLWTVATTVPAGRDPVHLVFADGVSGRIDGTWTSPVSFGFGPQGPAWQASDLAGLGPSDVARVESLDLVLRWSNGPDGGADFGIGVASGPQAFSYTNAAYQTSLGEQTELRQLDAADLQELGWDTGTPLQVGPSVSTGGFASNGIAYSLDWSADFIDPDPASGLVCETLGPVREDDVTAHRP